MPPPKPLPKYVYKIVPSPPPDPLPDQYPLSEIDQQDGFVHLSTAWQIPTTAHQFFKDNSEMWILKIRFSKFESDTKWDVEGSDGCAHLYGNFGAGDVESVKKFFRASEQAWPQVFNAEFEWLE